MSFTSLTFWIFFALVLAAYWILRDRRWQNGLLLVVSYLFYGWVKPQLAVMLGISTVLDFLLARGISIKPQYTRLFMILSLLINVGVLAFFKYYNFFNEDLARIASSFGMNGDAFLVRILLPAGLSFFTLRKLGYMIDVSRGTLKAKHTLMDFALYVSFFPQIVAGPIERPQKLLPQIESKRVWKAAYFYDAWPLLVGGLFKKIVIADSIQVIVDQIFGLQQPSIFLLGMGALAFTLQILADFSGYTDVSRGVALLLGFETSENFNLPYLSLTPTDFWNRWHITLSNWLRDYIFFPVGRALKRSRLKLPDWLTLCIPPIITMFISGLWHGAGWTYAAWGLFYGILISIYQLIGMRGNWKPGSLIGTFLAWLLMCFFIVFAWAMFRAPSLEWLGNVLTNAPWTQSQADWIVGWITFSMVLFYSAPLVIKLALDTYSNKDGWLIPTYYALATLSIIVFINSSSPDFIYFRF